MAAAASGTDNDPLFDRIRLVLHVKRALGPVPHVGLYPPASLVWVGGHPPLVPAEFSLATQPPSSFVVAGSGALAESYEPRSGAGGAAGAGMLVRGSAPKTRLVISEPVLAHPVAVHGSERAHPQVRATAAIICAAALVPPTHGWVIASSRAVGRGVVQPADGGC